MENRVKRFERATDLIEKNYDGQSPRGMPIYLVVDWEEGFVDVETRCTQIDGTPMREYHGMVSRWEIPQYVDARYLHDYVETAIMPLLNEMEPKFSTHWDGHNWVATWADQDLPYDFGWGVESMLIDVPAHEGGVCDARDWYRDFRPAVRADMTDEELQRLADGERDIALRESDIVLFDDLEQYLLVLREELGYEEADGE